MPLEADAQGIDELAINAAPEPSSVAARSSVNPRSTKPKTEAAADECDTPVATFPDRQTGCRGPCTSGLFEQATAATRRGGGSVCAVGTLGHGKVHAGAQGRCGTGRARRGAAAVVCAVGFQQDTADLVDAMLGKSAGSAPWYAAEEVCGRVYELLLSPAWSRAWLAVLTTCPRQPMTSWRGPGSGG